MSFHESGPGPGSRDLPGTAEPKRDGLPHGRRGPTAATPGPVFLVTRRDRAAGEVRPPTEREIKTSRGREGLRRP